jgi:molybdenum cofactor synthesis domain-containing protein
MDSGSRLYKKDGKTRRVSRVKPAPRVKPGRSGPVHAEVISVGRELVRGQVSDRNGPYLAEQLSRRGALVHRITAVDDRDRAITSSITEALERGASLVVTTGGLGPTSDDRTMGAAADAVGAPLAIHPDAKTMVEDAFHRLRKSGETIRSGLTRSREKMCAIPVGSVPVRNEVGIVPGALARLPGGAVVLCLPGVPEEARAVWEEAIPMLRELGPELVAAHREVEAPTADESVLQPWLDVLHEEYPGVWIHSHAPGFGRKGRGALLRFEARAPSQHEAELAVEGAVRRLLALAGAG